MEKKKMKLSLKKETVEILNQNQMGNLYGGNVVPVLTRNDRTCNYCESGACVNSQDVMCKTYVNCLQSLDTCIVLTEYCRETERDVCLLSDGCILEVD